MPGIFGIAASESAVAPGRLAKMCAAMQRDPTDAAEHLIPQSAIADSGHCGLGRVTLPAFAATRGFFTDPSRGITAVVDGEILNRSEVRPFVASELARQCSDAELLVAGYNAEGEAFFRRLEGKFAVAVWDSSARRLLLGSDRFGMKPLYYRHGDGELIFGSQIKALRAALERAPAIDAAGVSLFLTFGQVLGDGTMFSSVRVVPAATICRFDFATASLSLHRYWRPHPTADSNGTNVDSTLAQVDAAFQKSVDRCVQATPNLGIALSGGLDGRTIMAAVGSRTEPIQSLCLGMEGSLDHDSARRIAALTGCRHQAVLLDQGFLSRYSEHLRRMVMLTDGQYLDQCIVIPTLTRYRESGIDVLLRGHAGELMHLDKAYNFSVDREFQAIDDQAQLASWCIRRLSAYMLEGVDRPILHGIDLKTMKRISQEALTTALGESDYLESKYNRLSHLFLSQRTRRETALSMTIFGSVVETRIPYLDTALVEGLMALPGEMRIGDRVQSHIIRSRRPELLLVPNSNTGARMQASTFTRRAATLRMKILGRLGFKGYQPYERLGLWLRRELKPLVEDTLLTAYCLDRSTLVPDTVRWITTEHFAGRRNFTYLILALMIVELGRRMLADGGASGELSGDGRVVYAK